MDFRPGWLEVPLPPHQAATLPVTAVDAKQMLLRIIGKRNKKRILRLTADNENTRYLLRGEGAASVPFP